MRIDVQWLSEEKRVLHIVFHAKWDWNDFHALRKQAKALIHDLPYEIAIFIEYDRDADFLPTNALRHLSAALEAGELNVGMLIFVSPSQFWRVVLNLLQRLLPHTALKNSHIVRTREEGLAILRDFQDNSYN